MKIDKQLEAIASQQELNEFVNKLSYRVTFWKGRKFYSTEAEGAVSYNVLISKIFQKCNSNPSLASPALTDKLLKLHQDAEASLKKKNCFIRAMTYLKRAFITSSWKNDLKQMRLLEPLEEPKSLPKDKKLDDNQKPGLQQSSDKLEKPAKSTSKDEKLEEAIKFFDTYQRPEIPIKDENLSGMEALDAYRKRKNQIKSLTQEARAKELLIEKYFKHELLEKIKTDPTLQIKKFNLSLEGKKNQITISLFYKHEGNIFCTHIQDHYKAGKDFDKQWDCIHLCLPWPGGFASAAECFKEFWEEFNHAVAFWKEIKRELEQQLYKDGKLLILPTKDVINPCLDFEQVSLFKQKDSKWNAAFLMTFEGTLLPSKKIRLYNDSDTLISIVENQEREGLGQKLKLILQNACEKQMKQSIKNAKHFAKYGPAGLFKEFFEFIDKEKATGETSSEEIEKLDAWLGHEGKLIQAIKENNKAKSKELISDSVLRKALLKIHPDQAKRLGVSEEEATEKFKEFTKIAANLKKIVA